MPWVYRFLCVVLVGVIPCCQDGCGPDLAVIASHRQSTSHCSSLLPDERGLRFAQAAPVTRRAPNTPNTPNICSFCSRCAATNTEQNEHFSIEVFAVRLFAAGGTIYLLPGACPAARPLPIDRLGQGLSGPLRTCRLEPPRRLMEAIIGCLLPGQTRSSLCHRPLLRRSGPRPMHRGGGVSTPFVRRHRAPRSRPR
jgi:hypothetical protein